MLFSLHEVCFGWYDEWCYLASKLGIAIQYHIVVEEEYMEQQKRLVALVTGGSRGIGAATAIALAERGYNVVITYRNKAARASDIVTHITQHGGRSLALACDVTQQVDVERLFAQVKAWGGHLDLLILNASGGLERDLVAADPAYPMHINRDAQLALVDGAIPLMGTGGTVVFVTSHWAHLYGQVEQIPAYAPVGESKYAGEQALRQRQPELTDKGIRLIVVTGDLIDGTINPKLLERSAPTVIEQRRHAIGATFGQLPTAAEMGEAIASAATDSTLPGGHTVIVGGSLETLLSL
jgi:NAD(P)-dependent dehydrogenase (short-subunit alcohol dehydrogenase family)